jgi:hypothetical protein
LWACSGAPEKDPSDTLADTDTPAESDTPGDTDAVDTPADTDVDETDVSDTDVDTDAHDTDVSHTDTPVETDTPADTDTTPPTSCKDAGGICTQGAWCDTTTLPAFAGDCVFDDGPGVCCEAPPVAPTGNTCEDHGGVCAPISGCGMVDGYIAIDRACQQLGGIIAVCCIPEAQCGPEQLECCAPPTVYRSTCNRGVETCDHLPGTLPVPIGTCPIP